MHFEYACSYFDTDDVSYYCLANEGAYEGAYEGSYKGAYKGTYEGAYARTDCTLRRIEYRPML